MKYRFKGLKACLDINHDIAVALCITKAEACFITQWVAIHNLTAAKIEPDIKDLIQRLQKRHTELAVEDKKRGCVTDTPTPPVDAGTIEVLADILKPWISAMLNGMALSKAK